MDFHPIRSPFFYVGDKYKLMPQLIPLFPKKISCYIEPFVGGGSSFLNTRADKYILNDIDPYVVQLHNTLIFYKNEPDKFLNKLFYMIEKLGLSCSYKGITCPEVLKKQFVKTYYSHFNKSAYNRLKTEYNSDRDPLKLYLLLIYGFNHMIRFNSSGVFNLPVGNVDFNKNVYKAIDSYLQFVAHNEVKFCNEDYVSFLSKLTIEPDDFVYFDPPYLISGSEYNKFWNEKDEISLYELIDDLNDKKIKFGITNLIFHKGKINEIFAKWSKKYAVYNIKSNYISFNDNTIKSNSSEVYVTNVKQNISAE